MTTWSPFERRCATASVAAIPEANARPQRPPSSAARQVSRAVRVVTGARVLVSLVLPDRFLRERRGLEDRDDDGTGRGFRVLPGVDGERLEARLVGSLLHVVASMPRLSRDLTVQA